MQRNVDKLLTVADVAEMLQVSEQTVRNWEKSNALQSVRVEGIIRFWTSDIKDFLENGGGGNDD